MGVAIEMPLWHASRKALNCRARRSNVQDVKIGPRLWREFLLVVEEARSASELLMARTKFPILVG